MWKKLLMTVLIGVLSLLMIACGNGAEETVDPSEEEALKQNNEQEETTITLYFLETTDTSFQLGEETRTMTDPTPEQVISELLEGPESDELERIIPEGVDFLSKEVDDGVCYVDFTEEITQGSFGSEAEMVLVDSIVFSLLQFEDIEQVQFLVEGETMETLAGHVFIGEPKPVKEENND